MPDFISFWRSNKITPVSEVIIAAWKLFKVIKLAERWNDLKKLKKILQVVLRNLFNYSNICICLTNKKFNTMLFQQCKSAALWLSATLRHCSKIKWVNGSYMHLLRKRGKPAVRRVNLYTAHRFTQVSSFAPISLSKFLFCSFIA